MRHLGSNDFSQLPMQNTAMEILPDYPLDPKAGRFAIIGNKVQVCVELNDETPFWVPLTSELTLYEHQQDLGSMIWTIEHNMNTATPIIQCWNGSGEVILPTRIRTISPDVTEVTFAYDQSGRAVCMTGASIGTPREEIGFSATFTETTDRTFTHNLGTYPTVLIVSEGRLVQPKTIEYIDVNSVRVVFYGAISGTIQCR